MKVTYNEEEPESPKYAATKEDILRSIQGEDIPVILLEKAT